MIRVERTRVPRPSILASSRAESERHAATGFFTNSKRGRQQPFPFRIYRDPQIRDALNELFYGKCAYCEVRIIAATPLDVEMYRPKASVAERPEHPGYWWLASDWDNLLVACIDCNRSRVHAGERSGKANRFPLVDETQRAFNPGEETREQPLLLDPCRDDPESHLVFDESGMVVSATARGQATISVLGLNRSGLVEARKHAALLVQASIARVETLIRRRPDSPDLAEMLQTELSGLRESTEPSEEFAALKRQLIRPVLDRLMRQGVAVESPEAIASTPRITKAQKMATKAAFMAYQHAQSSFSLTDEEGRDRYRSERRLIERIVIHNVKAIRDLDLDLTNLGEGRTPWLMLLGENGTGKSTILQAIALTLAGASALARLGADRKFDPSDFVRYRCQSGRVSLKLSGFVGPHRLTFRRDRVEFRSPTGERTIVSFASSPPVVEGSGWEPQTVLLGYGATRLLPRADSEIRSTPPGDQYSRVDNLFDPFVPLFDAEAWLASLEPVRFDSAAVVLKDLLRLGADASFVVEDGHVLVADHGDQVSLRQVSDGYQSVVATAIDIFEVVMRLWPNVVDAEGIVLLDEIGAHLHPTWKMRIVTSVRRALPGIQFLTSTHDPLCLRGLGAGEVVVMQRDENDRVRELVGLPSPGDFRIDQLLTSDFFGLSSTVDPETEALFDEYYALLALPDPNHAQTERLSVLRAELKDRRYLGTTLRENLMYEAVDRLVARHRLSPDRTLPELRQEAADEVARLWAEDVPPLPPP